MTRYVIEIVGGKRDGEEIEVEALPPMYHIATPKFLKNIAESVSVPMCIDDAIMDLELFKMLTYWDDSNRKVAKGFYMRV